MEPRPLRLLGLMLLPLGCNILHIILTMLYKGGGRVGGECLKFPLDLPTRLTLILKSNEPLTANITIPII